MDEHPPEVYKLLLTAREAAAALSVCEKTLWSITEPRGDLPCVHVGRRVLYSVDDLRRWIDRKKTTIQEERSGPAMAARSDVPSS